MTTLEEMIEAARNLPPEDRRQLQRWLQEQEARDQAEQPHSAPLPPKETPQQTMERFRKAMNWIAVHRAEYPGQWVVLVGDQLISAAPDARTAVETAQAAGIETPFLHHVLEEPEAFYAGWKGCPSNSLSPSLTSTTRARSALICPSYCAPAQ